MKILCDKPLSIGWLYHQVKPPQRSVTFVVKGTFALKPGQAATWADQPALLTGDVYHDDDPARSLRYSTDFAPFKPRADLLLVGTAHAPGGQPTKQFTVAWRVGTFSKAVKVFGRRTWKPGLLGRGPKSDAERLAQLPLTYEHALGGPGSRKNPVGLGRKSEEVPHLELPGQPVEAPGDASDPAGFGPLASSWEPRTLGLGTYRGAWRKTRWPWFPEDFDWGHFNAAPRDQQIEGYLRGDEELEFENLHPEHETYSTKLPGLRVRCFLDERAAANGAKLFREVPLHLDTLWADLDAEKLILVWRGHVEVRTPKLKEVERLFVFVEKLSQRPDPPEEYRLLLQERLARQAREQAEAEAAARAARNQRFAETDRQIAALEQEAEALIAQAAQLGSNVGAHLAAQGLEVPEAETPTDLLAGVQEARRQAEASAAEMQRGNPALASQWQSTDFDAFEQLAHESMEGPVRLTRSAVQAAAEQRASLARQDLSGLDLSELDLASLDFTTTVFKKTNLKNAQLAGANFRGADLSGADLSGTDLIGAVLDEADLTGARLAGARLAKASFRGATLAGLELAGADFSGCDCSRADFSGANLARAKFVETELTRANFGGCKLEQADCRRARLCATQFGKVQAREINLEEADVTGIHASGGGDFTGANLRRVRGERSIWEGGRFERADFSRALLDGAQFGDATLQNANGDRATLVGAVFDEATLRDVALTNANLLRTSFVRADLAGVNFQGSNLYGAGFFEAVIQDLNLRGANIKNTLLS